ncbi:CYTH and CHAD domain-containing protein [Candidatus Roseilinea sp. NK_OTU-006]|jgi:CHAD domain-containing protein|nr:CHAD domain-containing protein [Candidatus Roseilinea sp. NK_OTU-006]
MKPTDTAKHQQEVEWQFDTDDLDAVKSWLRERAHIGDLQLRFDAPKEHVDGYYDTPDWRIFRAGYVLRIRQVEGEPAEVTLKSFGARRDGLRQRREINEQLHLKRAGGDSIIRSIVRARGPVGQRLKAVLGRRAAHTLRHLFDARTRRQRIGVYQDSAQLAEIALDEVSIAADLRHKPMRFLRVEVELSPEAPSSGARDVVAAFVAEMRAACRLQPAADSKFELGLRAQHLQPEFAPDLGQPAGAAQLNDDPRIGDLACALLREHFTRFLKQEPAVRLGEDNEAVHQMRVATRRLRTALRLFRDYLPSAAQALRDELRWVARLLGKVRDLDVQLAHLADWRINDALHALDDVTALLTRRREQAQAKLLRGLNSARYERLVTELTGFLRDDASLYAGEQYMKPARQEMPGLIRRRYDKLRKLGDAIRQDSSPSEYHALRIQCKRLRYALEFATPLYQKQKAARAYLSRLTALQDLLGLLQDAYVAIEEMRRLSLASQHGLSAQAIFALGEVSQRYAQQAEALRAQFPQVYRRIKGKAWKKLWRILRCPL